MIKESYVSLKTAMLLKEKGFDEPCRSYFINDGGDYRRCTVEITNKDCTTEQILRPTQQMAMAWLREEKYILIFVVPAKDESGNLQYMADVWTWDEDEGLYEPTWCTADYVYEKTVESALKYSLENLNYERTDR